VPFLGALGWGGGASGALERRSPRKTWFQKSSRLNCSAEGSGRAASPVAPLFLTAPVGSRLASFALASTFRNLGSSRCGFPRNYSTWVALCGSSARLINEPRHTQRTEVRNRSHAESGRSVGSARIRCSLVIERTFATSGPRATDTVKCGVTERSLSGSWSRRPERSCRTPCTQMPRSSSSSLTTVSGMRLPKFLTNRCLREVRRCEN
jgi:hypothetical protein